jgi:hypothetical protein
LVNDYKVTKEEISKCADLTDHTMKKVFDCLSLLLENAVLDWKTIKEKMFCITGKKEFENVEFLAKLV